MNLHIANVIPKRLKAQAGSFAETAGFGYTVSLYAGLVARSWDAKKRELALAGAGGIGVAWDASSVKYGNQNDHSCKSFHGGAGANSCCM